MAFIDNEITRFQNGVNNRNVGDIFNSLPTMDPTRLHAFWDDFDFFVSGQWTIVETGPTLALTPGNGGRLFLQNSGVDAESTNVTKTTGGFQFALGRRAYFRTLIQVNDTNLSSFVIGLQIPDSSPLDVTDGVFFISNSGASTIDFVAEKDDTPVTAAAVATLTDDTDTELAFYWDGISRIWYSVNGTTAGFIDPGTSLPDDEILTVQFGITNGEAVSKTMQIDYIYAAMER